MQGSSIETPPNWVATFRNLAKRWFDKAESAALIEAIQLPDRQTELRALTRFHLQRCEDKLKTTEMSVLMTQPMSLKAAGSFWFEYSPNAHPNSNHESE